MSKITITGTPRQYCADELLAKQQQAVRAYLETSQSLHRLYSNNHGSFFNDYAELVLLGYRLAAGRLPELHPNDYTLYLIKPASVLDTEVLELQQKVKQSYVEELELERVEFEAKLVAQMMAADQAKEAKALEAKQAKKLAEYKAIAANTYTPLQLPEAEKTATI